MILTLVSLSLTLVALFTSIFALSAVRRSSGPSLLKRLSEHSTQLEELTLQLRNLRSRLNMAAYRERRRESSQTSTTENDDGDLPDPKNSPEAWKRAMNRRLAMKGTPR